MTPQLPTVVLAGRSNVGKSKLYNKLKEQPSAVVSAIPGTTRDLNETTIQWNGVSFTLVDTAGLDIPQEQDIDQKVIKNTKEALEKADSILFVVDTKHGITPADKDALKELSAFKKNMLLVANKADSQKLSYAAAEFYTLGAGDPHVVSAVTGVGTGDLLDVIIDNLSQKIKTEKDEALIKLAFVGQPNVGKSSLVNALLGEERVLVHESPHTTRDPIDTDLTYKDTLITLVDTAGLRRPVKIKRQTIEDSSVHKTIQRLKHSTIIGLVIDITKDIPRQDARLGNLLEQEKKNVMIIANKWDLIPDKDPNTIKKYEEYVYHKLGMIKYAPIVFTSAIIDQRTENILDTALLIQSEQDKFIEEDILKEFLQEATRRHKPHRGKGVRLPDLYALKQTSTNPAVFKLIIKPKTSLRPSYVSFLERRLREDFGFIGIPITILVEHASAAKKDH